MSIGLRSTPAEPCYIRVTPARLRPELELGIPGQILVGVAGQRPQGGRRLRQP